MRTRSLLTLSLLVGFALCAVSAGARLARGVEPYVGTWDGTWDGSGSGNFELTLDRAQDGSAVGRVAVSTDGGNYTADLKSVTFDGPKMSAKYDFPLEGGSEVVIAATFEVRSAKGTWSLRPKGQESELAGGTWTVSKK